MPLRVGIFGCAPDTGNLGVSALAVSVVRGLDRADSAVECTLFDYGVGERTAELRAGAWRATVRQIGCAYSRRIYRSGNLQQMWLAARLGLAPLHPILTRLNALDAILDISGGDSFSDLYGARRFRAVAFPKWLALALGVPLVLLPQTYGPFRDARRRERARRIVQSARQAWARDLHSFETLRALLDGQIDPDRHRAGVDVAFGLPAREPAEPELCAAIAAARRSGEVLLGLNVSGLLYNEPPAPGREFGLTSSYRELVHALIRALLRIPRARIVLVPHVVPPCTAEESDLRACETLREGLGEDSGSRVVLPMNVRDPMEAKWIIGQCDWFCGTRMHACIAALSQGRPALGLAYSDKTLGVFETVGAGDWVVDLRKTNLHEAVARVVGSVTEREPIAARIRQELPGVERCLEEQFRSITRTAAESRPERARGRDSR